MSIRRPILAATVARRPGVVTSTPCIHLAYRGQTPVCMWYARAASGGEREALLGDAFEQRHHVLERLEARDLARQGPRRRAVGRLAEERRDRLGELGRAVD